MLLLHWRQKRQSDLRQGRNSLQLLHLLIMPTAHVACRSFCYHNIQYHTISMKVLKTCQASLRTPTGNSSISPLPIRRCWLRSTSRTAERVELRAAVLVPPVHQLHHFRPRSSGALTTPAQCAYKISKIILLNQGPLGCPHILFDPKPKRSPKSASHLTDN